MIELPAPRLHGPTSLEETLLGRRSVRAFSSGDIPLAAIGQLLWAGQGRAGVGGRRTAPSAGALYGLEAYAVTAAFAAHYQGKRHGLRVLSREDVRGELARAAWGQEFVSRAPLVIVLSGIPSRIQGKYGQARGERYLAMEAGHAAQNILLQAEALGYAGVPVGAFDDAAADRVLGLGSDEHVLYILPIGAPAGS